MRVNDRSTPFLSVSVEGKPLSALANESVAQGIALIFAADAFIAGLGCGVRDAMTNAHWSYFPNLPATQVDIAAGCIAAAIGVAAAIGLHFVRQAR